MRRAAAFAALLVLLATLCGCSPGNAPRYHYDVRRDLNVYFTNADEVIESVRAGLKACSPRITLTYRSSSDNMADIPELVRELMGYAYAETDDPGEGDYIYHRCGGYETRFTSERTDGGYAYTVTILPDYYTDAEQEARVTERVSEVLRELGTEGMSDYEKVRAVHDYVCSRVSYDRVHKKNEHYHLKATAYAALINGTAVCQGYSALMYRLLREAGVNARVITGKLLRESGEEYHAWNIVQLDGLWYNIDATSDSLTGTDGCYLRGEAEFSADHIRDEAYRAESFDAQYPMSLSDFGE